MNFTKDELYLDGIDELENILVDAKTLLIKAWVSLKVNSEVSSALENIDDTMREILSTVRTVKS